MEPIAPAPPPPPVELACPRCGAPHDRYQEYCLECGAPLRRPHTASSVVTREAWRRDSPLWLWAALLGLLAVALVAVAVVAAATRDDDGRTTVAVQPTTAGTSILTNPGTQPILPTTLVQPPTNTLTLPTLPTTTTNPFTTTTAATTTNPTNTGSATIISWPAGRDGYTIVLYSMPNTQPRTAAEAKAQEAINKGFRDVGVLDSSNYTSLTAGYWVVFYHVYDTEADAIADLATTRAQYPYSYVREVRRF